MRCKACDKVIHRLTYYKKWKRFEDLCASCRERIYLAPTGDELESFGFLGVKNDDDDN